MWKTFLTLGMAILGILFGCLLSVFWLSGGNTFWKPIDYFPFPVSKILALKPYGTEFWVTSEQNETYRIIYPCPQRQTCWQRSDDIPPATTDENYIFAKVQSGACDNDSFVYPLFRKIRMCATTTALGGESSWTVALALADNHELWIWNKPWESPYAEMPIMLTWTACGALLGVLAGILLNQRVSNVGPTPGG